MNVPFICEALDRWATDLDSDISRLTSGDPVETSNEETEKLRSMLALARYQLPQTSLSMLKEKGLSLARVLGTLGVLQKTDDIPYRDLQTYDKPYPARTGSAPTRKRKWQFHGLTCANRDGTWPHPKETKHKITAALTAKEKEWGALASQAKILIENEGLIYKPIQPNKAPPTCSGCFPAPSADICLSNVLRNGGRVPYGEPGRSFYIYPEGTPVQLTKECSTTVVVLLQLLTQCFSLAHIEGDMPTMLHRHLSHFTTSSMVYGPHYQTTAFFAGAQRAGPVTAASRLA